VGRIGGSKENPLPISILGDGFAVQEDNVAVEYNIPASGSKEELVNNINAVMAYLRSEIGKQSLSFTDASAALFPAEELLSPQAMTFGCDPDFNAWRKGAINPKPKANDWRLRSAGGHVHVGYTFNSKDEVEQFIRYLDLFLGVPAQLMDSGEMRKELYGKAGAFRYKPYGAEYRVLSNFWIFKEKYIEWVWNSMETAMDAWQKNKIDIDSERRSIINSINKGDKHMAMSLVNKYSLHLV
jgi:hypothetical protein